MQDNILERMYKATLKFLAPQTPEEVYATIVKESIGLVNARYGSLVLEINGGLTRIYSTLPVADKVKIRKKGHTYNSFTESKPFVMHTKNYGALHPELKRIGISSNIFIPLSYRGKSIGVLIVNSVQEEQFTNRELNVLKLFGSLASLAIRKSQLYAESVKALEARDLFISMAAHELRTPITTIYGYAQLLHGGKEKFSETEARWVEGMHTESYRLTLMMNDLLEINRIKSGRSNLVLKECGLRYLISRAIDNFKFNYPDRLVVYRDMIVGQSDVVIGDFDKILQVVTNLLDNAAKFSLSDKPILLTLRFKEPYFIVTIKDQGVGISKKDLPHVFEGYYRGRDPMREGMGLGLFLAKNIIDQHHGYISLRSRVDKGTVAEVRLHKTKI